MVLINEDGATSFNLHAAVQERVGWGYYDQGWNNCRDGLQSPLTGSPLPPRPKYEAGDTPVIRLIGLSPGQVLKGAAPRVEAVVEDRDPRWPVNRVEFFIDGKPYSYTRVAPFMMGGQGSVGERFEALAAGEHVLRVAAYDRRGPSFSESCGILEAPFVVQK